MNIRLASEITTDSIVDGIGLRTVIWTQGCEHNCKGCHNIQTHDINGGFQKDINVLIKEILSVKLQSGVTFSGGEPFLQSEICYNIVKELKKNNINIWCYTGFKYEDLIKEKKYRKFLKYIDILVDGPFVKDLQSYDLNFIGSSNQRIINVKESLNLNKVVLENI